MGQPGHIAQPADETGVMSLVFRAGPLLCALDLGEVIEIMRPLTVRPLAGTPPYVTGMTIMRGLPAPVVDVACLLAGDRPEPERFVAVRTGRGPVAFATGPVVGIRPAVAHGPATAHTGLLGGASATLVAGVGTLDGEPLLVLQGMRVVPDDVWAAAAAEAVPS